MTSIRGTTTLTPQMDPLGAGGGVGETPASTRIQRRTGAGMGAGMGAGALPGLTAFTPTNNLIGTQVNPTNSGITNWAQGQTTQAGNALANTTFSPFQSLAPVNFSGERGQLTGANQQMQGLGYNFGGANQQYTGAQSALGAAGRSATQALSGLSGLGGFGGGGANLANFSGAESAIQGGLGMLGPKFAYGADVGQARGFVTPALERAMNAPDRGQIAAESLSLLEARSQPGFELAQRGLLEKNAAMGRRGSGLVTSELSDLGLSRERELALARRDLANEAAARTLQDNMDRTNLALGVTQGLGGEDRSAEGVRISQANTMLSGAGLMGDQARFNAGQSESAAQRQAQGAQFGANFQRGLVGDAYGIGRDQADFAMGLGDRFGAQERDRVGLGTQQAGFSRDTANDLSRLTDRTWQSQQSERDAARSDDFNRANFTRGVFNDFSGFLGGQQTNDRANRNELRGERDFQYGLSRDAVNDEMARQMFEETVRNNRFNRASGTAGLGFGAGDLSGAYGQAAGQAGANSADMYGAFAQFLASLGNRGTRPAGGG